MSASTAPSPSSSTPFSPKSASPPRRTPLLRSYSSSNSSSSNHAAAHASPSPSLHSVSSPPAQPHAQAGRSRSTHSPPNVTSSTFASLPGSNMLAFASTSGLSTSHFASTRHTTLSPPASAYQVPRNAIPRRCSATAALGLAAVADRQAVIAAARQAQRPRRLSAPPVPDLAMPSSSRSSAQADESERKPVALSSPVLPSTSFTAMHASPPQAESPAPEVAPTTTPAQLAASGLAAAASAARGSISLTPAQRAAIAQLLLSGLAAESGQQPASSAAGRPGMTNSASFHAPSLQTRRDTAERIRAAFASRPSNASDPAHSSSGVNAAAATAQLGLLATRIRAQSTSMRGESSGSGSGRASLVEGVRKAAARRATLAHASSSHAHAHGAAAESSDVESDEEAPHASSSTPSMMQPPQRLEAPHRFAGGRFAAAPFQAASVTRRDSAHISPFAMTPSASPPRPHHHHLQQQQQQQHVSWQNSTANSNLGTPRSGSGSGGGAPPMLANAPAAAHEWAAYYAREQAWAGAALEQEARRHSGGTDDGSRARRDSRVPGVGAGVGVGRRPSTADPSAEAFAFAFADGPSAKRPRWGSGDSSVVASSRRNTDEAYRGAWDPTGRTPSLSVTRPSDDEASRSASPSAAAAALGGAGAGGGGAGETQGLVGVLSNFANLLEARQETCHGLESLARQAHTLGQLPVRHAASAPGSLPYYEASQGREESDGEQ